MVSGFRIWYFFPCAYKFAYATADFRTLNRICVLYEYAWDIDLIELWMEYARFSGAFNTIQTELASARWTVSTWKKIALFAHI